MITTATLSGLVDITLPDPTSITPRAIAHGLAQVNRWCGSLETPLSVAQHSVLVFQMFRSIAPLHRGEAIHALLHDGHEYLIGDITRPAEQALERRLPGVSAHLAELRAGLDRAIRRALGVPEPSLAVLALVHEADMIIADVEWRTRMPQVNGPSPFARFSAAHPKASRKPALPVLSWADAADAFRTALALELAAIHGDAEVA